MGQAKFGVGQVVLEELFGLPANYKISDVDYVEDQRVLVFEVNSDNLPYIQNGYILKTHLVVTVDRIAEHPEYKRIKAEVKLL